ncbi:Hypothetical protein R9X50_00387200 [Acrodontium crateriforme]|uniref:DNA helicase n=1 Tax=Acrodontium crateriforme TaxID=150365 RepID=A0AAQ3M4E8_9PEZI|nr:Hypothetical protein R9X50_00387200 [Acrodontium crateriforme]
MVDFSDPISDGTPHKRRKLDHNEAPSKIWDSQDDGGEDLFEDDFQTVPTQSFHVHKRKAPGYSAHNFHSEIDSMAMKSSQVQSHTTQPTQPLPTNSLSAILVDRSSPPTSPPTALPRVVPFAKPRSSLLASSLAPQGTAFRLPTGVQPRRPVITLDDSDDEPDPPVQPDSDDEGTQGLRSNIKPTNFKRGGRVLNSTPNRSESSVVRESPQAPLATRTAFSDIMRGFEYNPSHVAPLTVPTSYEKLEDVPDYNMRRNIERIQTILPGKSVQTCYDALLQKRNNMTDALELINKQDDEVDELSTMSPVAKRGVANPVFQRASGFIHPVKPKQAAKQVVAGSRSIAEKYGSLQAQQRQTASTAQASQLSDDDVRPKGRLIQRRKQRSLTPASPPQKSPVQRVKQHKKIITISDDDEDESESRLRNDDDEDESDEDVQVVSSIFDEKLLKYLDETTVRDLSELCALSEDAVKFVLDQRPFSSLDEVRAISKATETKSGKKSRSRPIGDKIVDVSSEMLTGYDAVDELVKECAELADPIKHALKTWGLRDGESELQLMNLDEAHDSGIGTPASSCAPDDFPHSKANKNSVKNKFLGQPENMGEVVMKDYQLVGLNWLNLLWSKKISCILADDMGLGKTCQVIAFLAHLQMKKVDGVHLVIVPGSTLENWLREFARFAPSLRVVPYYGSQSERPQLQVQIEEDFSDIDVIVTTYDMTRAKDDNKFLRNLGPAVCVYDEAHALRNPKSDRYTQLMKIPADFKVLLTGTPLQNNLQELIAILAFIMPDLFQGKREELDYIFKHKATTKDTAHAALLSSERIARARTMMTPFILRRKKQQVLDLPTKHSRVEHCDMTESQEEYYNGLLAEAQQFFADKAMNKTKSKGSKESTNILMALRKAAIHPLLSRRLYTEKKLDKIQAACTKDGELAGNPPQRIRDYLDGTAAQSLKGGDYGLHVYCADAGRPHLHKFALKRQEWMDSGKVQVFKRLVKQYQENGDRLLVFSQFTTLMDVLEAVLETMDVKFFRLDGSTAMNTRQDMIDEFHNDTSIPVFMLSTKAGGAGINLACANKVIIFDSGFNPQDDIQAENRAHRVGQTREVEVVRLVSKGTIEEQIHALGESKIALDEQVSSEATTAAEDKAAEKSGQEMVEKMLMETLNQTKDEIAAQGPSGDLKDAFKLGMEEAGVTIGV